MTLLNTSSVRRPSLYPLSPCRLRRDPQYMSPEQARLAVTAVAGQPASSSTDNLQSGSSAAQQPAVHTVVDPALLPSGTKDEHASSAIPDARKNVPRCANCGADVPRKYCGRCGQRIEHHIHSVVHFTREVAEDLT